MITLTTPPQINTILGGTNLVDYDRFVLSNIRYNTLDDLVASDVRITSSSEPDMTPMLGSLAINPEAQLLIIAVPQLDYYVERDLTPGQATAAVGFIRDAQDALENGLLSLGDIVGTHATGS